MHSPSLSEAPVPPGGPQPPYFAVIFTSVRHVLPEDGYAAVAARMEELARAQPGFLGVESARGSDGFGITVSYWATAEAVRAWGQHAEHLLAQALGRDRWYETYTLRVAVVERAHSFTRTPTEAIP